MTVHWISTAEAARRLHLSPDSVLRRIKAGELPAVRCGRLWLVRGDLLGGAR